MNSWGTKAAAAALMLFGTSGGALAQAADVTIFAAASLKNALDSIIAEFRQQTGKRVTASYAASSALARQIEQDAPADIFISADVDWMNYLQERRLLRADSRRDILSNRIVLVAPSDQARPIALQPGALTAVIGSGRIAVANTAAVPAGKYARAALEALGLWSELAGRLAEAENVRAALSFVARGEVPLGIVYETDARAEPRVAVVARFPETSHPRIVYQIALTTSAKPSALQFMDILRQPAGAAAFEREGFRVLE